MISDKDGISIEWLSKMIGMDGQSRWSYSGEIVPVALLACQVGWFLLQEHKLGKSNWGHRAEGKKQEIFTADDRRTAWASLRLVMSDKWIRSRFKNSQGRSRQNSGSSYEPKATSLEKVGDWLLKKFHIVISNYKCYLGGTFYREADWYHKEYIDEFVFRFQSLILGIYLLPCQLYQTANDHDQIRNAITYSKRNVSQIGEPLIDRF